MSTQFLRMLIFGTLGLFAVIVVAYLIINKFTNKKNTKFVASLVDGTRTKSFSRDIMYQRIYLVLVKIPFLRRYILKLRRRLEIINLEDEYMTRLQTARIMTRSIIIVIPLTIVKRISIIKDKVIVVKISFIVDAS